MIRRFCLVLCGIALTWLCAACGVFLLRGQACSLTTSKHSIARARVRAVAVGVVQYTLEHNECPGTRDDLVKSLGEWSLVDPWGTSIAYWCSDDAVNVMSAGPDRIFGTGDDLTSER